MHHLNVTNKIRSALLVIFAVGVGVWFGATPAFTQSPSTPGILGWYPTGGVWVRVQVDKNGVVQTGGGAGTFCPNPCPVTGSAAAGAAAGNPVTTGFRSDTGTVLPVYGFPDQAAVAIAAGTDTVMAAGVAATLTYVGHVSFTLTAAETVTIQQGTGVTCGTNTVILYGPAPGVVSLALDYDSTGALHSTVTGSDICLHLGGSATAGGGITYGHH